MFHVLSFFKKEKNNPVSSIDSVLGLEMMLQKETTNDPGFCVKSLLPKGNIIFCF